MRDGGSVGTVGLTRLFTEALNARDVEALLGLVTDDVEFPTPQGRSLRGADGVAQIVRAVTDADLFLARVAKENTEEDSGIIRVTVSVREIVRKSGLDGTADFRIRDGGVASFEVITDS
ncbi:MAG TPA: nuclear transport factor 2 family protein [Solirubrobacteraceae bacterium]|nr:nuclear transport factor 2 family protein [Solirubrobacteraceae bacterium]